MSDQTSLYEFNEAKAVAEGRRQQAIRQAHRAFDRTVTAEQSAQVARYRAASEAWEAVKGDRDAEGYNEARQASETAAKEPANHEAAYAELDRAIRAADAAYHAELREIAAEHGVLMSAVPVTGP
jgi:hypothetical protein